MSRFWTQWLSIWCLAVGLFGVVLMTGAFDSTDGMVRSLFQTLGGDGGAFSPELHFAVALMGAVSFGWAITAYGIVTSAPAGRTWRVLTLGVVAWFVTDSTLSIATGFGLNAVSNAAFLAAFLLPILQSGVLRTA